MSLFEAFDEQFKGIEPAGKYSQDRVPPAVYQVVCAAMNLKGDGVLVDHEVIDNRPKGGKLGLKIFLEILAPESVTETVNGKSTEVKTKGKIVEHIFWISDKTAGSIMRDVKAIAGVDLQGKFSKIESITWAGHTCEAGVKDNEYNGWISSRVNYFNAWNPGGQTAIPLPPGSGAAAPTPANTGGHKPSVNF